MLVLQNLLHRTSASLMNNLNNLLLLLLLSLPLAVSVTLIPPTGDHDLVLLPVNLGPEPSDRLVSRLMEPGVLFSRGFTFDCPSRLRHLCSPFLVTFLVL